MEFANINTALVGLLAAISDEGREITTRGQATKEIGPIQLTLRRPDQRCMILPNRNNNVFASIAETMWVLAGRNDLGFLANYLPRAADFSDDGRTWRAGYGPRLRDWHGVDQVDEVRKILLAERTSRRAVVAIFDPGSDFVESKDIPCNNWLHFICRDSLLNCHVAVRSNDAIWGFSGINAFEWSVLLELLSYWIGVDVGRLTFSVTSAHIYSRHYSRANSIVEAAPPVDIYSSSTLSLFRFQTPWQEFDTLLADWFALEQDIRCGSRSGGDVEACPDPLLRAFLQMLRIYWAIMAAASPSEVLELVEPLRGSDLGEAALEYASRRLDGFPRYAYEKLCNPTAGDADPALPVEPPSLSRPATNPGGLPADFGKMVSALHNLKSAAYGDSWKRRGELIGIMSNIARKVDRLQVVDVAIVDDDETALDTAVDLLVYSIKYATYLMDHAEMERPASLAHCRTPLSDGTEGFDAVLQQILATHSVQNTEPSAAVVAVQNAYGRLEQVVDSAKRSDGAKPGALEGLVGAALQLIASLSVASPASYDQFARHLTGAQNRSVSGAARQYEQESSEDRLQRANFFAEHNRERRFSYE